MDVETGSAVPTVADSSTLESLGSARLFLRAGGSIESFYVTLRNSEKLMPREISTGARHAAS